jgi:N,N'-diacetyllegionaminate synthase
MNKTLIIAEAGVNHNGDISIAKRMIDCAVEAKVDAIKFQTFKTENLVSSNTKKADYQIKNTAQKESQFEMLKKLELDTETHLVLMNYCKAKKIKFMSTPFDIESIRFLAKLGLDTFKIASGEITHLPYLRAIGKLKKKVILSTGMSNMIEIKAALDVLLKSGTKLKEITLLHANTEYPTPFKDVNLNAMISIKNKFKTNVGYSDHTLGIQIPIAAVALGATVIEKHFTLDRTMDGPDHIASLEPNELKEMVNNIRIIETSLGDGIKAPSISEQKNINIARKSIHTKKNISKGELFTENNIIAKRPGNGISPMKWDDIIGKKANRDFKADELITLK